METNTNNNNLTTKEKERIERNSRIIHYAILLQDGASYEQILSGINETIKSIENTGELKRTLSTLEKEYLSIAEELRVKLENNNTPSEEKDIAIKSTSFSLTSLNRDNILYWLTNAENALDAILKGKNFDERYQEFLEDVKENTEETANNSRPTENGNEITWQIIGIEFLSWKVEEKYGKDIYEKACEEVPYTREGFHRIFSRNFESANIKLGHLVSAGISASPLLDLDYYMKLLLEKGIPSYIDFKTNTFHYNAIPKKEKTIELNPNYKN